MDAVLAFFGNDLTLGGALLSLVLLIVIGAFFEVWVPGRRYRRLEKLQAETASQLGVALGQNTELLKGVELGFYAVSKADIKRKGAE